jgi:hypothetical protein
LWSRKLLALVLVLLMVAGFVTAVYANSLPRQVDPSQAFEEVPWAQGVYEFYSGVLAATASGNFANSTSLLALSAYLHIPSTFTAPLRVFDNDIGTFNSQVQKLGTYLNETSRSLKTGFLFDANGTLTLSRIQIHRANQTLLTMESDAVTFASREGIPPSLLLPKVQALASLLQARLQTYDALLQQYDAELAGLLAGTLHLTLLTLSVDSTSPLVGSPVSFTGRLVDNRTQLPISGAAVRLVYQGANVTSAKTNADGVYSGVFLLPGVYRDNTTLRAVFSSDWLATGLFPSHSAYVFMHPVFFVPLLNASVPTPSAVDSDLLVNGQVTYQGAALPDIPVTVQAFNNTAKGSTDPAGTFSLQIHTPVSKTGDQPLLVSTSGSGPYAPVDETLQTDVVAYIPKVEVGLPYFVLSGFAVHLSGTVVANGSALPGALIQFVGPGTDVQARADGSGMFNVTLYPSLTLFSGTWSVQAKVFPNQPWVSQSSTPLDTLLINPLIGVYPVVGVVVFAKVVSGRRRRRAESAQAAEAAQAAARPAVEVSQTAGVAEDVLSLYSSAVAIAERASGASPTPSQTLREYLSVVRRSIEDPEDFTSLTGMAEGFLYGGTGDRDLTAARDALSRFGGANDA